MVAPSSMTTPGADDDVRLDEHVLADPGVMAEEHGFRRHQRRALRHDLAAQTLLHRSFGLRKLGAGVHAENLIGVAAQHMRVESIGFGQRYRIGEIELALGVGVADTRQKVRQCLAAAEAHDAGIA